MPHSVALDVSQKITAICVVDTQGRRVWRGTCPTDPGSISQFVSKHSGADAKLGVETGAMTPWLVHGLRTAGLDVAVLDARRVEATLQIRLNETCPIASRERHLVASNKLVRQAREMIGMMG